MAMLMHSMYYGNRTQGTQKKKKKYRNKKNKTIKQKSAPNY